MCVYKTRDFLNVIFDLSFIYPSEFKLTTGCSIGGVRLIRPFALFDLESLCGRPRDRISLSDVVLMSARVADVFLD